MDSLLQDLDAVELPQASIGLLIGSGEFYAVWMPGGCLVRGGEAVVRAGPVRSLAELSLSRSTGATRRTARRAERRTDADRQASAGVMGLLPPSVSGSWGDVTRGRARRAPPDRLFCHQHGRQGHHQMIPGWPYSAWPPCRPAGPVGPPLDAGPAGPDDVTAVTAAQLREVDRLIAGALTPGDPDIEIMTDSGTTSPGWRTCWPTHRSVTGRLRSDW
jgi:hypothetical protein